MQDKDTEIDRVLHLYEYQHVPREIAEWKNDDDLVSSTWEAESTGAFTGSLTWYVGIGTYKTRLDGEIYMCTLLDSATKGVIAYSFGVHRSPELVGKAMDVASLTWHLDFSREEMRPTLLCSRNPIYRTKSFAEIVEQHRVMCRIAPAGSRGLAAPVSTYFSQLMRRKGGYEFRDWQGAVEWLERDAKTQERK